jgi:superfamily II DNA or RNA helicase
MQRDALENLRSLRKNNQRKAILISATGTGKTILSALDVKEFLVTYPNAKVLFIAHSNTILEQSMSAYQAVLKGNLFDYGLYSGACKQLDRRFVFGNINSLRKATPNELRQFNYVIVDETHKAGATSYINLLSEINPTFLLGMTATPE